MKAVLHDTLPLATTSAFTPRGTAPAGAGEAWSRALQDAREGVAGGGQGPSWAGTTETGAPGTRLLREPSQLINEVLWRPASAAPSKTTVPPGCAAGRPALAMSMAPELPQPEPPAPVEALTGANEPDEGNPSPAGASGRSPGKPLLAAQPAVRIHVELQSEGVAVWLGIDGSVESDSVDAIVRQLRDLPAGAPPLLSIVRNGTTVYARSSTSKETP